MLCRENERSTGTFSVTLSDEYDKKDLCETEFLGCWVAQWVLALVGGQTSDSPQDRT